MPTDLTDQAATVDLIPKSCFTGVSPVAAYLTSTKSIIKFKYFT